MKSPDLLTLVSDCEARLSASAAQEMERERLRVTPEKTALIAEIVSLLIPSLRELEGE